MTEHKSRKLMFSSSTPIKSDSNMLAVEAIDYDETLSGSSSEDFKSLVVNIEDLADDMNQFKSDVRRQNVNIGHQLDRIERKLECLTSSREDGAERSNSFVFSQKGSSRETRHSHCMYMYPIEDRWSIKYTSIDILEFIESLKIIKHQFLKTIN